MNGTCLAPFFRHEYTQNFSFRSSKKGSHFLEIYHELDFVFSHIPLYVCVGGGLIDNLCFPLI